MGSVNLIQGINEPYYILYNLNPSSLDANYAKIDAHGFVHTVAETGIVDGQRVTQELTYDVNGNVTEIKTYPSGMTTGAAVISSLTYNVNGDVSKIEDKSTTL